MNIFRSKVDVFEAINRCDWQKVKDAVVPGKVSDTWGCTLSTARIARSRVTSGKWRASPFAADVFLDLVLNGEAIVDRPETMTCTSPIP